MEEFCEDPTDRPHSKVWTRDQKKKEVVSKMAHWRAQMQDNPEGGELDPANDI